MATSRKRGKLIILFLSFSLLISDFFYFPRFSCLVLASEIDPSPNSNSVIDKDCKNDNPFRENLIHHDEISNDPDVALLRSQQLQLEKLEELVKNLTQLVSRLESQLVDAPVKVKTPPISSPSPSSHDKINDAERIKEDKSLPSKEEDKKFGAVLVTKYNTFWSERFQFMSAVKLSSSPTCISVLPYKDFEGLTKYFAVGDNEGKLYIFLKTGDVSLEFNTFSELDESSPITAMVSYLSIYKNESMILTGHENGDIIMHRAWETFSSDELSSLHVERVGKFEMPESSGAHINILEIHHIGRKRYILASDASGKIMVFKENGMVYGSATPSRRPIVFLKQRLLFLTETGAGSLDLRTMRLKETECEGLNGSFVENYVFDAMDRSKAHGTTSDGDLIQTLLLGDVMNFKCRIRSKKKLESDEKPLSLQAIKGYLLISNMEKVFVYNVSSQHYVRTGGLRLMFSAGHDEIISSFSNYNDQIVGGNEKRKSKSIPLITGDYEKLVIISLGNGYVAMYRSNLPVFKNEFNSILWTSPVLFFILFLFGAYHFFANKKEALTAWGPDDPFTSESVTGGAPLGGSGFPDSSRSTEIMDLRGGGGLRGSSRYVSPPRFSSGPPNSYRTGPDSDSRPTPVEARFRTTSEMKFRGSNVEAAKRRESMFVNSQVVDDGN